MVALRWIVIFICISQCIHLPVLPLVYGEAPIASTTAAVDQSSPIICTCRCCYRGGCRQITNISWTVSSCDDCTTNLCKSYISSTGVREEVAHLFESIKGDNVSAGVDVTLQECEVIAVLEAATCTTKSCKRTSTIKAECYNRDAPLIKYSIISLVAITVWSVIFGLIKNYIPAFQSFNEKYFNY